MKTQQEIREYIRLRPELRDNKIADNLRRHGVTTLQVKAARHSMNGSAPHPEKNGNGIVAHQASRVRARDLSEFRKAHDIPQKIRDRVTALRPSSYLTEEELRQLCDVAVQNWRRNAELPEFADNKFKHDGVIYWGSAATIREMKKITGRA